jgi:hypothetical protein
MKQTSYSSTKFVLLIHSVSIPSSLKFLALLLNLFEKNHDEDFTLICGKNILRGKGTTRR